MTRWADRFIPIRAKVFVFFEFSTKHFIFSFQLYYCPFLLIQCLSHFVKCIFPATWSKSETVIIWLIHGAGSLVSVSTSISVCCRTRTSQISWSFDRSWWWLCWAVRVSWCWCSSRRCTSIRKVSQRREALCRWWWIFVDPRRCPFRR